MILALCQRVSRNKIKKKKLAGQNDVVENLSVNLSKTESVCVELTRDFGKEIFARAHTAAHKPTSAQRFKAYRVADT